MQKDRIICALLILFFTTCTTAKQQPSCEFLCNEWIHSYEEDKEGLRVFRPSSYDFPRGWNREKIIVEPDGNITLFEIAPNDAMLPTKGYWELTGDQLSVTFPNNSRKPVQFEILENDTNILVLKR